MAIDSHFSRASYVCPMHPQARSDKAGPCPVCGMAFESEGISDDAAAHAELRNMTRRFWISAFLTVPVVCWEMRDQHMVWQAILATPIILWGGRPFFQRGWMSLKNRRLNMFTLIALGVGVNYIYSLMTLTLGRMDIYFESAATIVALVLLGQVLELRARQKTSGALRALLELAPKTARRRKQNGEEEEIALADIQVGDELRIRPGEKIPVDGVMLEGATDVDESMVTGESMPVDKTIDAKLIGGTLNGSGSVLMRAERVGADTLLSHIIEWVSAAQRSRAPIQRMADQVAGYFVPAVIVAALVTALAWWIWGPAPRVEFALVNAVAVLLIACPCALGLATPMSIMVATGAGARSGILIKDASALEMLARVDTLVLDKTGTLTQGRPHLARIQTAPGFVEQEVLRLAASLEQHSEHPLAKAVVHGAMARALTLLSPTEFSATVGQGIQGNVGQQRLKIGNAIFFSPEILQPLVAQAEGWREKGETVLFVIVDDKLAGILAVADPVKATTRAALDLLNKEGLQIVMLSGDHPRTAEHVAQALGIKTVIAGVLPQEKCAKIKALQAQGHRVAMVGDGTNDAPALAQADVGIAMGTGTDVAIESAGITLVKGDLRGVARARALSHATLRNIKQNLFFSFFYNALGIPVAAGVLYPHFGVLLSPMLASAAMSASSLCVIANALRLRQMQLKSLPN